MHSNNIKALTPDDDSLRIMCNKVFYLDFNKKSFLDFKVFNFY